MGTDGGAMKGATAGLDMSDEGIQTAWTAVMNDTDETTWMVLEYEGKSKLKVKDQGSGGAAELLAALNDDGVYFGGLRLKNGKGMGLMLTGENAGAMVKGRAAAHKNAAMNAMEGKADVVTGQSLD